MSFRDMIAKLEKNNELIRIKKEINPKLEIAKILSMEEKAVLFENVKDSKYKVVGNLLSRKNFAAYFGMKREDMLRKVSSAIDNPSKPKIVLSGQCQEVVEKDVNLYDLPIPLYTSGDMGPYITAGVFIANDPEYGPNASFHRATPISKNKLTARICERDLYAYIQRAKGELDVAICIGLSPAVLLSAAISVPINMNELEIANTLEKQKMVKCKTSDILVPADSEIVLEGKIIRRERHKEGPFLDITGTFDTVREEPIIEIKCITHRKDPIYQALVSSLQEHKFLMGTPREVVMFNEINKVCKCEDVILTDGSCSWLNGVVKIKKKNKDDGKRAIEKAFQAHKSMKHVVIVDDDIDIHNIHEVDWAIATRFQGNESNTVIKREKGSSLDPSADEDRMTTKIGIDATIPLGKNRAEFTKGKIGE